MKQAIIYARARNSNTLKDQITVYKLFATRNGFQIIRVICQTGSFPSVCKLTRIPIDNIIIASPSVLGSPAYFLLRRTKFNLEGKRIIVATKEDQQ